MHRGRRRPKTGYKNARAAQKRSRRYMIPSPKPYDRPLLNVSWIVKTTEKLVGDKPKAPLLLGAPYVFSDPAFIGKTFILEDTVHYIRGGRNVWFADIPDPEPVSEEEVEALIPYRGLPFAESYPRPLLLD